MAYQPKNALEAEFDYDAGGVSAFAPAPVTERKDPRSDLMRRMALNPTGATINGCPFGCEDSDLDENGYCKHLIGFTDDGKTMELRVFNGHKLQRERVGPDKGPVLKTDKLLRISTSYRVYREQKEEKK